MDKQEFLRRTLAADVIPPIVEETLPEQPIDESGEIPVTLVAEPKRGRGRPRKEK